MLSGFWAGDKQRLTLQRPATWDVIEKLDPSISYKSFGWREGWREDFPGGSRINGDGDYVRHVKEDLPLNSIYYGLL